jgi:hypothetical protein
LCGVLPVQFPVFKVDYEATLLDFYVVIRSPPSHGVLGQLFDSDRYPMLCCWCHPKTSDK